MAQAANTELVEKFEQFYRDYYRDEIGKLARGFPNDERSLYVDWGDLYRFDADLADDYLAQPGQLRQHAEEALRLYDLPVDVKLGGAHVRVHNLGTTTEIRDLRSRHVGRLVAVQGLVRKATDVRPKLQHAAFECQRCGSLTPIEQSGTEYEEPHECQGCERQGPFQLNVDQSEFVDSQQLRVQESPEGLRGGETPRSIDVRIEDDLTGEVAPGDHVTVTGILRLDQSGGADQSPVFEMYMDGVSVEIDEEEFEDMEITEADKQEIIQLSDTEDLYDRVVDSIAPSIYGYEEEKLAMALQLFSGVTKELPDGSRIRGDLHILLIGDPGTGKSQLLQYIRQIAPRSVYTSGKGSSSAGLTAAAVRDDFGEGEQWSLEAGALVLADRGIAAVDELDKMRCVTGDSLVHTTDGVAKMRDLAIEAATDAEVESLSNGRTLRDLDLETWTMTDDGRIVRRPVTAIHEYEAPDDCYEVTLESGESITTTADHPFFVLEDGERAERAAERLGEGDWVYVPRRVPSPAADGGAVLSHEGTTPTGVGDDAGQSGDGDGLTPAHGAVLGYLAGDGNVFYDRQEGCYGIRFTNKEEQLLADFERTCRDAFDADPTRPPSDRREDGVETVRLSGKEYVDELLAAGANLETYHGKRLPEGITRASRATKTAFVRALADSEGTVDDRTVKITSSSYDLLLGTKMLLSEFGVSSQIQTRRREERRDVYLLAITADESLAAFHRHVGFTLDRKREALASACETTSGDRTILDVVPDCGERLRSLRERLRLHQSECGIDQVTYWDFENGNANLSIHRGERILDAFEARVARAGEDADGLGPSCSWSTLETARDRYHVTQREIAEGTDFSQQQVSRYWGECDDLRAAAGRRLRTIAEGVAGTDLGPLRELVAGDVKWRRVASVDPVDGRTDDDRIPVLRHRIGDLIERYDDSDVESVARELVESDPSPENWDQLAAELDRWAITFREVADAMDVAGSTVSRWFGGVVDGEDFGTVRDRCLALVEEKRRRIESLLAEIERRRRPRVYDLTVEGTHNFLANGMVVHNSEDRSAMHQALEQQEISISKAGINATLKSRCALLGAANPKYGRFDQYEPLGEQIDLEPALISRFDLIFTVTDQPDEEKDRRLADHILTTNYAGELNTQHQEMTSPDVTMEEVESIQEEVDPAIESDLFRKYVAYAKQNCHPRMTEAARSTIEEFYTDLRLKGTDEDAPVPITARKLEAVIRLAEASARIRLSDEVTQEDADRVIRIVRSCMEDVGIDPESGEFDADVVETGTSKSQRERIKNLKTLIDELADEYEEGAPREVIADRAEEHGISTDQVEHEIKQLKEKGEIYETRTNHYRVV